MKGLALVPYRSTNKTSCPAFARCGKQLLVKPRNHIQVVEPTRVSTTADGVLTAVLFGDVFFVGAFFPGGFCVAFTATFLPTVFAVTAFLAAGFVATAVFATLLAEFFLPASFALPASAEPTPAPSTRNLVRSFAAASHAGAGPRPLQVAPVFGSRDFAGCGPLRCPLDTSVRAATEAFLAAVLALLTGFTGLTLAVRTASIPLAIRNLARFLVSAIHAGARPWPVQVAPVLGCRYLGGVPLFRLLKTVALTFGVLPFAAFASRFAFAFTSMSTVVKPCASIIFRIWSTAACAFFAINVSACTCNFFIFSWICSRVGIVVSVIEYGRTMP